MSDQEPSWGSRLYIDYVYVPGFLLVFGTAIVKKEWLPYAAALALALGVFNIYNFRESNSTVGSVFRVPTINGST